MTVLTGDTFYLEFDGVVLTSDYREFDPGVDYDTAEGTAGGDTLRKHMTTKLKVEPTATIVVDSDATGLLIAGVLEEGHTGNLIWGPKGNGTGMPKAGIVAKVKKVNIPSTYDAEREYDVEWINTDGAWLFDPTSATFS